MNNYEQVIDEYRKILLQYKKIDYEKRLELCEELYNMLYLQAEMYQGRSDAFDKESKLVKICIATLIPIVENTINDINLSNELLIKYLELYENLYYFAGRRSFKHFLLAMEFKWKRKVFKQRMDLFEPITYYLNKMALDNDIKLIRISMPPGFAKSLTITAFSAFVYGLNPSKSILRISASDLLVKQFGRDTVNLLKSESQGKIFPYFAEDRFIKKTEDEFQLQGSNERNFLCKTRDSTIVGFRTDYLMEDDLIGGTQEAMNNDLHTSIYNKHIVDWTSRAKNEDDFKIISIGTMFNPEDLLCKLKELAMQNGDLQETKFDKYVEVYKNRNTGKLEVFITIPALDDDDKSTLECEFSTKYFLETRENLLLDKSGNGNYHWQSTFMQKPIYPTGLSFSYDNLQIYDELPKDKNGNFLVAPYSIASLDPNRKGNDYVSMPIFIPYADVFYMVDCFFRKGAMSDMYDDIVDMIIKYNVRKLYVEINVDGSLPELLKRKLQDKGYNYCEIIEIYSVVNKEQRIKDNQGYVKKLIMFPNRKKWKAIGSEFKEAMEQMMSYSFEKPNKHDDSIDSICIMVMENIPKLDFISTLSLGNRKTLGI